MIKHHIFSHHYLMLLLATQHLTAVTSPSPTPQEPISLSSVTDTVQYYKYSSPTPVTWQEANATCYHDNMTLPTPQGDEQWRMLTAATAALGESSISVSTFLGAYITHQCYVSTLYHKTQTPCEQSRPYGCYHHRFHFLVLPLLCPMDKPVTLTWQAARKQCLARRSPLATSRSKLAMYCILNGDSFWVDDSDDYLFHWIDGSVAVFKDHMRVVRATIAAGIDMKPLGMDAHHREIVAYLVIGRDGMWQTVSDDSKLRDFICQTGITNNKHSLQPTWDIKLLVQGKSHVGKKAVKQHTVDSVQEFLQEATPSITPASELSAHQSTRGQLHNSVSSLHITALCIAVVFIIVVVGVSVFCVCKHVSSKQSGIHHYDLIDDVTADDVDLSTTVSSLPPPLPPPRHVV